ncbi:Peptidase M20D, amidohydrolase [Arcticibacter svalbardensis MN12-7]|uniref:Peptidase M20D, amidohydrolase n=1 Tax=Arcticibacter svalbardensis MN12-7 TaxID=1150600 RepID=R9GTL0_9SPHI|nr:amidohydrolase [Arcticibacter svalbardensis]EOR95162.1 Peptidase M20D, amidohydrolase [Arcticibacter svalbardensis MN12-7]
MNRRFIVLSIAFNISLAAMAQNADKEKMITSIQSHEVEYAKIAKQIWEYAEPGYLEVKSSALLEDKLKQAGFMVTKGVAEIPTAFVATYGSGKPVIGILAEFDALPGLSQTDEPVQKALVQGAAGHGCGHNLFGTASVAAAIAVKDWMKSSGGKGTLKVYGCPAEEGGSGKVYLVRAGLFNDVDAVLHWHPGNDNTASVFPWLANKSAKFRFHGIAAHASAAPEKGRSALDAVEGMDNMVNMMREHIPSDTRIHYVITHGGEAPNVVPAFAEVYYYVRNPDIQVLKDVWDRVVKAAQGAAMGAGTTMDYEVIGGTYNMLPNVPLSKIMYENLKIVGGFAYTPAEKAFAEKIQSTFHGGKNPPLETTDSVVPFEVIEKGGTGGASSDVGDVSWNTPTAGIMTATFVPGSSGHSWQNVAAAGNTIGAKGMMVAAKTIALSAYDLFNSPDVLTAAKKEFAERRGADFKYESMLGDRKPALDYRK